MVKRIFLRQAIELIERANDKGEPIPFDIEVRTFNKYNSSGGSYKIYKNVTLLVGEKLKGKAFIQVEHFFRKEKARKNPNHWDNATRNIQVKPGVVRKIHIRYIIKINGLEVVY